MTPRELFNAWMGWSESRNEELEAARNIQYGAARFNASATSFSKEQSKATANHKFPWEKGYSKEKTRPMDGRKIAAMLNFISKPE